MLFATTSNGVYCCDLTNGEVRPVLANTRAGSLLKPEARGFFGIARHTPTGEVIVASRERRFFRFNKVADHVKLYRINPVSLHVTEWTGVEDVHDVHQIAWHDGCVFLTDTGKNRIVIHAPGDGSRRNANVGAVRDDVNHINAVLVHEGCLYVGLNNRAVMPAALLRVSLTRLFKELAAGEPDLLCIGEHMPFDAALYTHDLEPDGNGRLFSCSSSDGCVFEVAGQRPLLKVEGWTRGLAFGRTGLWVGSSEIAGRKDRHSEKLDGVISRYALPGLECAERLALHKAGQVNDLLYVEDADSERFART